MSLQVWLPLNGNLNNLGLYEFTPTINTSPTYVNSGKIGKAMALGSISIPGQMMEDIFKNKTFSICFWVYVNADTGDTAKKSMFFGSNSLRRYALYQYPTCNDFHWSWKENTAITDQDILTGVLPSYTWTHCAVTYNGETLTIYINGASNYSKTVNYNPVSLKSTTPLFANCPNNGKYLNDYRIYDHCLSAKEVEEIAKALILHYPLDNNGLGVLDSAVANSWGQNIAYDCSGYGNDGTITGSLTTVADTPRYSCATKMTNGQYIRVNNRPAVCMPKDAITINLWQYATSWANPISCTQGGGWNFENGSSGIRFSVYISSVGYKVAESSITSASTQNAWHMLTGTMDKDNIKIYYDGEEVGTVANGSTNGIGYANNYIFIGAEAGGDDVTPTNSQYAGNLSDIRIYATALTPAQIKELYTTAAAVDKNGNIYARELVEI